MSLTAVWELIGPNCHMVTFLLDHSFGKHPYCHLPLLASSFPSEMVINEITEHRSQMVCLNWWPDCWQNGLGFNKCIQWNECTDCNQHWVLKSEINCFMCLWSESRFQSFSEVIKI